MSAENTAPPVLVAVEEAAAVSRGRRRRQVPSVLVAVSSLWLVVVGLAAVLGPFLRLHDTKGDLSKVAVGPSSGHPLGTDSLGRDELARLVMGAHNTAVIVVCAVAIAMVLGLLAGITSGFLGGVVDRVVGILSDTVLAFPTLVLLMTLVAIRGASVHLMAIGFGFAMAPTFARLARAGTLTYRSRDFVTASVVLGTRTTRVLVQDILPNIIPSVLAYGFVIMGVLTIAEGSLSYLGFGVPSPGASWGGMIADGESTMLITPRLVLVPAVTLFLTVLSLNLVGEALQRRSEIQKVTVLG